MTQVQTRAASGKSAQAAAYSAAEKYLIFTLAGEEFGVQILAVREIIGMQDITFVPHAPAWVKGVINLRSKVVPVIDLRIRFEMPEVKYGDRTCIVVAGVQGVHGMVLTGLVVDSVVEVLNIAAAEIQDSPDFGERSGVTFLFGMAKVKERVKMLLDIEKVTSSRASVPSNQ